eukprot:CAMPEP_0174340318 /NCGR_PEP_ID=MMETSP0810-20121108/24589_1 /TAXON_ID=73025 ORGANISM="Eutreptiella gymnastica-like, Strain CCMP1594" /NCGR_SAMPLE_ID=MMETSP0810 /ASSEMBLY_ACC=CAM_ASM_000659 /LENGTH=117 /DNA_ID=CAMNT_0015461429 /DNA_START=46 /DNA_END=400 /DNA_ORIENTATION=+
MSRFPFVPINVVVRITSRGLAPLCTDPRKRTCAYPRTSAPGSAAPASADPPPLPDCPPACARGSGEGQSGPSSREGTGLRRNDDQRIALRRSHRGFPPSHSIAQGPPAYRLYIAARA